jgi:hypothetical protein
LSVLQVSIKVYWARRRVLAVIPERRRIKQSKRTVKIVILASTWLVRNQQPSSVKIAIKVGTKIRKDSQIVMTAVKVNGVVMMELRQRTRVPSVVQESTHLRLVPPLKQIAMDVHLEKLQVKQVIRKHLNALHAFQTRTLKNQTRLHAHRVTTPNFRWKVPHFVGNAMQASTC